MSWMIGRQEALADPLSARRKVMEKLRTLSELDGFNQLLAIFETGAHLDLLAAQGRVAREDVDGVLRYR